MKSANVNLRASVSAAAIATALLAGQAGAATLGTLDIGGVLVYGGATTSLSLVGVGPGTLTEIAFDFDVFHFSPSWAVETEIQIVAPDGDAYNFDAADFGFGGALSGLHSFSGSIAVGPEDTAGDWVFNFNDSFNDGVNPDHLYMTGSSISLIGTPMTPVPLPAGMALSLSGLAALGAAGLYRRRKGKPA